MLKKTRQPLTAVLPRTSCTRAMARQVRQIAKKNRLSQAEIIRQAVEFFLSENTPKSGEYVENGHSHPEMGR